ncbi:unnamed protein product [Cyclocybe aegerita]|uniref:F-box domain-containing protein n=1 Tax=Cyclocybe aegerita TaxID=1973307 RepID=A0A8S0W9K2_CYCAE|nr:unnamed protein product [Cyclocybe aegerita]
MAATSLRGLPPELQFKIMVLLDAASMLSVGLSCRTLHELFRLPSVQYLYDLHLSVMQENGTDTSLDQLHSRLRCLRKGWESLDWTPAQDVVNIPGSENVGCFVSGMFIETNEERTGLTVHSLPSATQGGHSHYTASVDFRFTSFDIDPGQDVIVFVGESVLPNGTRRGNAHIRTLSAHMSHPDATVESFPFDISPRRDYYDIKVVDDVLVVITSGPGIYRLLLWNWQKGFLIYDSTDLGLPPKTYSFKMLGRESFFLTTTAQFGKIHIYKFSPTAPSIPRMVAMLELPISNMRLSNFFILSPKLPTNPTPGTMFAPRPDAWVHVFSVRYFPEEPKSKKPSYMLFVQSRTLLQYVHRAGDIAQGEDVPWGQWGEHETRFIAEPQEDYGQVYPYGHRVLRKPIGSSSIDVLDFSEVNPNLASPAGMRQRFGRDTPTLLPPNNVFPQQVITRLPFHVTSRPVERDPHPYYMMDEERVVESYEDNQESNGTLLQVYYF